MTGTPAASTSSSPLTNPCWENGHGTDFDEFEAAGSMKLQSPEAGQRWDRVHLPLPGCTMRSHVLLHCMNNSSPLCFLLDGKTQIQQDGLFVEVQSAPAELLVTRSPKRIRLKSDNETQAAEWVELLHKCIQSCQDSCHFPIFETLYSEQSGGALAGTQISLMESHKGVPHGMEHGLIEQMQHQLIRAEKEARISQKKIQDLTAELEVSKEENNRLQASVDDQVRKIGDSINVFREQKKREVDKLQQQVCKLSAQLVQTHFDEHTKDHEQALGLLGEIEKLTSSLSEVERCADRREDSIMGIPQKKKGVTFNEELLLSPILSSTVSPGVQSSQPSEQLDQENLDLPGESVTAFLGRSGESVAAGVHNIDRLSSPHPLLVVHPPAKSSPHVEIRVSSSLASSPALPVYSPPPGPSTTPIRTYHTPTMSPGPSLAHWSSRDSPSLRERPLQQPFTDLSAVTSPAHALSTSSEVPARGSLQRAAPSPARTSSVQGHISPGAQRVKVVVRDTSSGNSTPRSMSPALGFRGAYKAAVYMTGSFSPSVSSTAVWQPSPTMQQVTSGQVVPQVAAPQTGTQPAQPFLPMSRTLPFLR